MDNAADAWELPRPMRTALIAFAVLFAAAILGNKYPEIKDAVRRYRENQARAILEHPDPREV